MKNICALTIALISIGIIPNVKVEANVLDIVEAYRDQINYKEEKIQSLDSKILALTLKPENMEIWKELSCERRKAMRSYIHSANKILESKELKSPELKNAEEIKSYLVDSKNYYLLFIAEEDQVLQSSAFGRNTIGFETFTLDNLCQGYEDYELEP